MSVKVKELNTEKYLQIDPTSQIHSLVHISQATDFKTIQFAQATIESVELNNPALHFEIEEKVLGNSTEALINSENSITVQRERSMELLGRLAQSLINGNDIVPFVVGMQNGKPICMECNINDDGTIELPVMQVASKTQIRKKNNLVKKILHEINPVLKAEIENVTFIALMRKDETKLQRVLDSLKKGIKPKLENRVGCIWIIIGDEEFVI